MTRRRKRVWLHPDSGLEGWDGCLRLLVTALIGLVVLGLFVCLVATAIGGGWQWFQCVRTGDC